MIAKMKSGRIITGKLAETFSRIGIAKVVDGVEEPKTQKVQKPSIPVEKKKKPGTKSKGK